MHHFDTYTEPSRDKVQFEIMNQCMLNQDLQLMHVLIQVQIQSFIWHGPPQVTQLALMFNLRQTGTITTILMD